MSHSADTESTSWPELLILHLPPPFALTADALPDRSAVYENEGVNVLHEGKRAFYVHFPIPTDWGLREAAVADSMSLELRLDLF